MAVVGERVGGVGRPPLTSSWACHTYCSTMAARLNVTGMVPANKIEPFDHFASALDWVYVHIGSQV